LGAGGVSASLIGRLPSKSRELGPVSAISFRVASRIANTLRAGYAVRRSDELEKVSVVLFHSPPENAASLLETLETAEIEWKGKAIVFCDCTVDHAARQRFQARGASTAVARQFGFPARIIVEGNAGTHAGCDTEGSDAALQAVHRIARELRMKAVEISSGTVDLFDAAVTLGNAALTPLIDAAAALLRKAGIRDIEAARLASSFFEQTARDYAHSGKQSWAWYVRKPSAARLDAEITAAGPDLESVFQQLILFGFLATGKHKDVGCELVAARLEQDASAAPLK
jgi:pyrroline-5-carboxylate reductase